MTEQDKLIELQLNIKDKTRVLDILNIVFFVIIIFGFAIAFFIIPDNTFSEQENRYLQQSPKISSDFNGGLMERIEAGRFLDRLFNGKFTAEINKYYADQFPFREMFVGLKAAVEISMLKQQNNSVTLGSNGYIIKNGGYPNYAAISRNADSVLVFGAAIQSMDVPCCLAAAGRSEDVLERYLPKLYPNYRSDELWDYFDGLFQDKGSINYVNLRAPLKTLSDSGTDDQLYYRTDHHWTTLGAYYAYVEIMKSMGLEPQPRGNFTAETASESFYGTTWSSAGMKWIAPDVIEFFRYAGDGEFITEIIDDPYTLLEGFYDVSYLDVKDKYSSFIGGNHSMVKVYRKDGVSREKILMIKDSFAHCMVPFLAYHFDMVIIDPRYYKDSVKQLIKDEHISKVLILSNIDSFIDGMVFGALRIGLEK